MQSELPRLLVGDMTPALAKQVEVSDSPTLKIADQSCRRMEGPHVKHLSGEIPDD